MTPNPTSKSASLTPGGGAYRLLEMPAFEPTLFRFDTFLRGSDKAVGFHKLEKFYSKILKNIAQMGNPFQWRTYISGKLVMFSPLVLKDWLEIDEILEENDDELTTNSIARELIGKNWLDQVGKILVRIQNFSDDLILVHRLTESLTHICSTWIKTASVRSTPGFSKFVPSHPFRGSNELVEVSTQPPETASPT
ncbi:Hypothetical predicted protein [Olea europaea subsp. europaea]|uniref:Uncharacterized protein n=1 Tax=Olea europaea subsp. europaea TaxID=158383 RepID=A0A8S0U7E0_OLEEU|nr:Hypothetical predicted protein [Olea europaea subsp. europaea]